MFFLGVGLDKWIIFCTFAPELKIKNEQLTNLS